MKIYGFPTFNLTKVLLTAEELGLDYDYIALDPAKGEHKTPEHLQRHPLGKVPVLEHEGDYLYESAAICRYLSRISDSRLYSGDAKAKAKIDQWIDFGSLHIGKWLASYFFEEIIKTKFYGGSVDHALLAEA
ncbi:MAG: glutathione S-transferase N-terminal domain-containing protein, partial [Pseudomonadales bacterium]|nr:glutathione S-transferase N-terminal domain-containing protein [Pseudomonadales bacterium]